MWTSSVHRRTCWRHGKRIFRIDQKKWQFEQVARPSLSDTRRFFPWGINIPFERQTRIHSILNFSFHSCHALTSPAGLSSPPTVPESVAMFPLVSSNFQWWVGIGTAVASSVTIARITAIHVSEIKKHLIIQTFHFASVPRDASQLMVRCRPKQTQESLNTNSVRSSCSCHFPRRDATCDECLLVHLHHF